MEEVENFIDYFDYTLNEFTIKLASVGLDENDYQEITKIISQISLYHITYRYRLSEFKRLNPISPGTAEKYKVAYYKNISYLTSVLEAITDIFNRFIDLKEALEEVLPCSLEKFLNKEASLMHLVFTNNKSLPVSPKIKSRLKSLFLCHFHREKTPSMEIDSLGQYGFCYGCGFSFDMLTYFSNLEGNGKEEAMDLLCRIYYIEKENNKVSEKDPRIKKYQDVLLNPEYRECLLIALNKTETIENNSYKRRCYKKINRDLETIERIRKKEPIYYNPNPPSQKLTLEWKE